MADRDPHTRQQVDQDGVRTIETAGVRTSVWLFVLAMALVALALFVVVRPAIQQALTAPPQPSSPELAAQAPAPHPTAAPRKIAAPPAPALAEAPRVPEHPVPPAATPPAEAAPPEADGVDSHQTAGEASGIALFPPPGTKPIKIGIVVPDDVELPPGYVRHYQTTDDGRQLPPILMFHPDYQPVDEHGEPIPIPDDRIVPADMAPAGMAIEMLEVPGPDDPAVGGPGRARNAPRP